jgi:hypothetical protein
VTLSNVDREMLKALSELTTDLRNRWRKFGFYSSRPFLWREAKK